MKTVIRRMGNSWGVLIPKPLLAQVGLEEAEMLVGKDCIVLRRPQKKVREGWAEASRNIASTNDDKLVWPQFANADDTALRW